MAALLNLCFTVILTVPNGSIGGSNDNWYHKSSTISAIIRPKEWVTQFTSTPKDPNDCAVDCSSGMTDSMKNFKAEFNVGPDNDPFSTPMNQKQFQTFCSESMTDSMLDSIYLPMKYMCDDYYEKFLESTSCRNMVNDKILSKCIDGLCKDMKNATSRKISDTIQTSEDLNGLQQLLVDNCKFDSCAAPCEMQIVSDQCGSNVAQLMKGLNTILVSNLHRLLDLKNLSWMYPSDCLNLA